MVSLHVVQRTVVSALCRGQCSVRCAEGSGQCVEQRAVVSALRRGQWSVRCAEGSGQCVAQRVVVRGRAETI